MDLSRYAALFLADTRDHLRRANGQLVDWERRPSAPEPVDELFRAFHSIKGSAATMGYRDVERLAHSVEHLLEAVRRRALAPSRAVMGLLFRAVDLLERGLDRVVRAEPLPDGADLAAAVERLTNSATPSVLTAPPAAPSSPNPAPPERRVGRARVDPARLDELLQQAGELVVARNRLVELVQSRPDPELEAIAGRIDLLTRTLHAGVLRVRLAPMTELFGRFPRVVRDLAQRLGKSARLELEAEGIELDRSVLEELADPLVHLVRNAVDHGIEGPDEREAIGKPAEGLVVLKAERHRDHIAIRLADDGRGIDRERVFARAIELGYSRDREEAAAADLVGLLARPGFTLKREVTELSGRGVGMDVVATKVRSLGGSVALTTTVGQGTEFVLTVPITTAVQRVLLVGTGATRFAIPFRLVREATLADDTGAVKDDSRFSFRGSEVPFRDLRRVVGGAGTVTTGRFPVLILEANGAGAAVGVESLHGQHDVLLERLEAPGVLPSWVSGATILGDGAPAFVVDPTALF